MKGIFKSFAGATVIFADGSSCRVAPDASVLLDGKNAKMADLKPGDDAFLSGDPATSVTATRPVSATAVPAAKVPPPSPKHAKVAAAAKEAKAAAAKAAADKTTAKEDAAADKAHAKADAAAAKAHAKEEADKEDDHPHAKHHPKGGK